MKNGMTLEKARMLVKSLLIAAGALCIIGLVFEQIGLGEEGALYAVVGAIACIALAMAVLFTSVKCPYCGHQLFLNCLTVKVCPACKRNLSSGLKSKGKKRK